MFRQHRRKLLFVDLRDILLLGVVALRPTGIVADDEIVRVARDRTGRRPAVLFDQLACGTPCRLERSGEHERQPIERVGSVVVGLYFLRIDFCQEIVDDCRVLFVVEEVPNRASDRLADVVYLL